MAVFAPDGQRVGELDLARFRAFKTQTGQVRRAFIAHLDLPEKVVDGWYRAEIVLKDGSRYEGRDYVVHHFMAHPTACIRSRGPGMSRPPSSCAGIRYRARSITRCSCATSGRASAARPRTAYRATLRAASGLIRPGGEYVWRIHARDSDGNVLLGDFNHGSLSPEMSFTVR